MSQNWAAEKWPAQKWAVQLPRASVDAAARLRLAPALAVCDDGEHLWLRGNRLDEPLDRCLRLIPGGRRFSVLDDGQLVPQGCRVPLGRLPDGPWTLLSDWLHVRLPEAAATQLAIARVPITLVRGGAARQPELLETTLAMWADYVADAPQWRIDRWSFAACGEGRVIVRGTPLAPLPGTQWTIDGQIATPAGCTWSPPVDAVTVAQALGLAHGELALLRADGGWDAIAPDAWVRASRSAARTTQEATVR